MKADGGLCLGLILVSLLAAPPSSAAATVHSRSGQFVVRGTLTPPMIVGPGSVPFPTRPNAETQVVTLDPDLLAVSAERIKHALLRELELPDTWRGTVYVDLWRAPGEDQPVRLTLLYHPNGWQYHLEIPDRIEKQKAIRAIVEVSLLEIANRKAGGRSAEIPSWLIEGMMMGLMGSANADLLLQPETDLRRQWVRPDPLAVARGYLRANHALTFTELSLPAPAQLSGEGWTAYQACAQLFVHDLLNLRSGRACAVNMLPLLPDCLNWQTAFLRAFDLHFRTLLDVEKWWAVSLADFTGHDRSLAWPRDKSLRKLDEILGLPVQVRYAADRLPATTDLTLQTVIAQWDFAHQRNVLQAKANLLLMLRLSVAPELVPLVDGYRSTLTQYLGKSEQSDSSGSNRYLPAIRPQILRRDAIQQLDALDARREALRQRLVQATNSTAKPQP
ncbi:MAG: hypothetical protein ACYDH9_02925 [Limisphaerales bacterium]